MMKSNRVRRVFLGLLSCCWLMLFAPGLAHGAKAPGWVETAMSSEARQWRAKTPATILLRDVDITYSARDRAVIRSRGIIQVNTEQGLSSLRTSLSYEMEKHRIHALRAWQISPGGKVREIQRRQYTGEAGTTDNRYWNRRRSLTYHGDGEVGSVLAWEHVVEVPLMYGMTGWRFELSHPTYAVRLTVTPAKGEELVWHSQHPQLQQPKLEAKTGTLVWEANKLPNLAAERPTGFIPTPCMVEVRSRPQGSIAGSPAEDWRALSELWSPLFQDRTDPSESIRAIAAEITKDKPTQWDKLAALAQYVQAKIAYLSVTEEADVFAGYRPALPGDVIQQQLGDCKDKAALLLALARCIGVNGVPILVNAVNPLAVQPNWAGQHFNHVYVGFPADTSAPAHWSTITDAHGRRFVVFDPTHRTLAFGTMPQSDVGRYVLVLDGEKGSLVFAPDPLNGKPSKQTFTHIELEGEHDASVRYSEINYGSRAGDMKSWFEATPAAELKRQMENVAREALGQVKKFEAKCEWMSADLTACRQFSCVTKSPLIKSDSTRALFVPVFPDRGFALDPWKTSFPGRSWLPELSQSDTIKLVLPEGTTVATLPSPIRFEHEQVRCEVSFRIEQNVLVYEQRLQRPAKAYTRAEYEALRQGIQGFFAQRRAAITLHLPAMASPAVASAP